MRMKIYILDAKRTLQSKNYHKRDIIKDQTILWVFLFQVLYFFNFKLFNPCCSGHKAFIQCSDYVFLQGNSKMVPLTH